MTTKITEKLEKVTAIGHGSHSGPDDGMCVMEAVSWVAGEPFSDHPACVSPVIGAFMRSWNDALPTDEDRTRLLKPLIPVILNTVASPEIEQARSYLALDWMIRTYLPTWLRAAKLDDEAAKVEALEPVTDYVKAEAAGPVVRAAQAKAAAARAAAWAAARAAAWAAAGDAAWAAAWDAAWDATRAAVKPTVDALQASAANLIRRMASLAGAAQ